MTWNVPKKKWSHGLRGRSQRTCKHAALAVLSINYSHLSPRCPVSGTSVYLTSLDIHASHLTTKATRLNKAALVWVCQRIGTPRHDRDADQRMNERPHQHNRGHMMGVCRFAVDLHFTKLEFSGSSSRISIIHATHMHFLCGTGAYLDLHGRGKLCVWM